MVKSLHYANPFKQECSKVLVFEEGLTIWENLTKLDPSFKEFPLPTICVVNGRPCFRAEWRTRKLKSDDIVSFQTVAGDFGFWLIVALVVIAVGFSVYTVLTIPKPATAGEAGQPDSVYNLTGQKNQIKLGSSIECPYGLNRLWPSYAARPYNKFIGNDQWYYGLYCLGHGKFEISAVQIEDTNIANFQDVEFEIYGPGEEVTLIQDNVVTSSEVSGVELFGPNEDDYVPPGAGFSANEAGTEANHLEVDLILPKGLYFGADDGSLTALTVQAAVEYREIDNAGAPVGAGTWILPKPISSTTGWTTVTAANKPFGPLSFKYLGNYTTHSVSEYEFVTGFSGGTVRNDFDGFAGFSFIIPNPRYSTSKTIKALGRMMLTGNSGNHLLKVVRASDGLEVASVTVNMTGGTVGQFKYADLSSSVILQAGIEYWFLSEEVDGGDTFYDDDVTVTTASIGTLTGSVQGGGTVETFNFAATMATNTPQRFTFEWDVEPARYEVRVNRINDKNESSRAADTLIWETLRSFLPSTRDFGNVTTIAIKAKASNNLNSQAANRLNVIATRMLPIYDAETQTWSAETATRNAMWALCDACKNTEYGGKREDSELDLERISELAADHDNESLTFDFVFDQKISFWDALRTICRVGRGIPIGIGSRISVYRDTVKTIPTSMFNHENILKGSFQLETKLAGVDEFDGVEVEYRDPTTYLLETVLCTVGDEVGDYPERIRLQGCSDRTVAYREGLYIRRKRLLERQSCVFDTELEGRIPMFGDLTAINRDKPVWGKNCGVVESISDDRLTLYLTEPVTFQIGTNVIGLRTKTGEVGGPYTVTAGADSKTVILEDALPNVFAFDDQKLKPIFSFGLLTNWSKNCVISKVEPKDDGTVTIRAVPYNADVFLGDTATPPALPNDPSPPKAPDLPEVSGLEVLPVPNTPLLAQAVWTAALGSRSYVVQISTDGFNFETIATPTSPFVTFAIRPGDLWVRVAGINVGAGPWNVWNGTVTPESIYPSDGGTPIEMLEGYVAP